MRILPEYSDVSSHNIVEIFIDCAAGILLFLSAVCEIFHLQHENPHLAASMHDEHRSQAADTDGEGIDDITSQDLRKLSDLKERGGTWIEEAAVDRER